LTATRSDLPPEVAAVLASAVVDPGTRTTTRAAGIPFSAIEWGSPSGPPLILIHGVTASARIWWRIGPALSATGRRVIAVDLPGHGRTGNWRSHHRFADNAADVAAWIRAAGLDAPALQVVGHSWGGMTAAALPRAGLRPATLVLLDPPAVAHAVIARMASDPSEQHYGDLDEAIDRLHRANPAWSPGDVEAKAEALVQLDVAAARAVLLDNGDWDGGLADLAHPARDGIQTWLIRADPAAGGFLPEERVSAFENLLGADRVLTLPGAPHAPQRTHPADTTAALLHALG
jgi:pimeloyl-ACP methyl ester carboxylesterase